MPIREIITFPNPLLREKCTPVERFDSALESLIEDMAVTMYASAGIGLAASQIGVMQQIAVVDISQDRTERIVLINPEILEATGSTSSEEGCLSIPGYRDSIKRHEAITVRAKDQKGTDLELRVDGLLAICIQHEVDHLQGILFVDHLSRLKREFFKRWAKKNVGTPDER